MNDDAALILMLDLGGNLPVDDALKDGFHGVGASSEQRVASRSSDVGLMLATRYPATRYYRNSRFKLALGRLRAAARSRISASDSS